MDELDVKDQLLSKLRCVRCSQTDLYIGVREIVCRDCEAQYPIRNGRFPDFLTEEFRKRLNSEIEFWTNHFGGTRYGFESNASYRMWANLLDVRLNDEVLEIGCGSGSQLQRIQSGFKVGVEPVPALLNESNGFAGVIGVVENLPFRDESFDLAYFSYSLHHVADREQGFSEAVRIIRPGGRLAAIEPNANHPQRKLISNPKSSFRKFKPLVGFSDPHESFFSAEYLCKMANKHGLQMEKLVYAESNYERPTLRFQLQMIYSRTLGKLLPDRFIYPSFFVSYRKNR